MEKEKLFLIKKLKKARGYSSQGEVAIKIGLSQPVLSKIEAGVREPTALELWKLAEIYKKPLSYFFPKEHKNTHFITEENISALVDHYGYYLLVFRKEQKFSVELSLEETILAILQHYPSPRLLMAVPVLLYLNDINVDGLFEMAWRENMQNRLGFVVSIAIECIKSTKNKEKIAELSELNEQLKTVKLAREDSFQENIDKLSEKVLRYLRDTRDSVAQNWNILDRFYVSGFKEVFDRAILAKD